MAPMLMSVTKPEFVPWIAESEEWGANAPHWGNLPHLHCGGILDWRGFCIGKLWHVTCSIVLWQVSAMANH